jgi:hypothetical protein
MATVTARDSQTSVKSLTPIHILLTIHTVIIILVTINRLSNLTTGFVLPNEFLRWLDFHNMLTLPIPVIIVLYLLKQVTESADRPAEATARARRVHLALNLVFVVSIYIYGVSYGNHELSNYLHQRFCGEAPIDDALCRIVIYNDDAFSHYLFFGSFIVLNSVIMIAQALHPYAGWLTGRDWALLLFNALFIALGIFANLAFEEIGFDLYVVFLVAALALLLIWRRGRQPLLIYYAAAYGIGLVATLVYKGIA